MVGLKENLKFTSLRGCALFDLLQVVASQGHACAQRLYSQVITGCRNSTATILAYRHIIYIWNQSSAKFDRNSLLFFTFKTDLWIFHWIINEIAGYATIYMQPKWKIFVKIEDSSVVYTSSSWWILLMACVVYYFYVACSYFVWFGFEMVLRHRPRPNA